MDSVRVVLDSSVLVAAFRSRRGVILRGGEHTLRVEVSIDRIR